MATATPTVWAALAKANIVDEPDANASIFATNEQSRSKVIGLADGGYFLTWEDGAGAYNAGLEPRDITARSFNAAGAAIGSEFNGSYIYNDLDQQSQAIAQLTNGNLVVAYQSSDATGVGDLENIDVSIFAGANQGHVDFRELGQNPAVTFANDTTPAIAALSNSKYAVIYARDAAGNKDLVAYIVTPGVDVNGNPSGTKGPEVTLESSADDASVPDAATLINGNFVVVYQSSAGSGDIAFTLRSGTDASAVASGTVASGASAQTAPQVAALKGGGFVVVWNDATVDSGNAGVRAQIYTSAGATSGGIIALNTTTLGSQSEVAVTQLADGGFLAAWTDDASNSVKGQRFNAAGTKIGVEFTAASLNDVSQPDLALMSDGRVVLSVTNVNAGNKDIYTVILDPREVVNGTNNAETLHSRKDGATINAFGGNDNLIGYNGADVMKGGTGNDTMTGANGNDTYVVDSTGDRVIETSATSAGGRDTVYSSLSSLTLSANVEYLTLMTGALNATGNSLANKIVGNASKNTLLGAAGNDTITGGAGRDIMTGGSGADDFDCNAISETGKTSSTRDVIKDFTHGSDDIDLSTIDANGSAAGNTGFKFLSAKGAAFTGFKGEIRWYQINAAGTANDKTIIEGNTNGDARADFHIELTGLKALSSIDFIL